MVTPPIRFDYGYNIHIGKDAYLNLNTTILDFAPVFIGNNVMIGPGCSILTPYHPADAVIRNTGIGFAKPITIENDVWLGGNVTITGGVTIEEGSVVGAGSVVIKDIPKGVIAVGNPCKVIRKIVEKDAILWQEKYDEYLIEMGEE